MRELPELDIAELLDSEEVMAAYLSEILATGDSTLIMSALGDIARAKGMSSIARETGLNRESLYKAFRPGTEPHHTEDDRRKMDTFSEYPYDPRL